METSLDCFKGFVLNPCPKVLRKKCGGGRHGYRSRLGDVEVSAVITRQVSMDIVIEHA